VRATSRKHWAIPGKTPAVRAAGVWLASAALLTCAFSWSPQPAGAATSAALAAGRAPAVRLVVGLVVQRHLLRLFAAYRHIPLASIAAAASGQVLGARMQRDGRQWAMVHWQPSARAGQAGVAGFQDGGGTGVFTRPPGGAWTVAGLGGQPAGCAVRIPAAVRRLWHLSGCPAAEGPPVPRYRGTGAGGVTGAVVKVYTGGTGHGQHISFGGAPKAGDAVILYPPGTKVPNGSYADHVGIVTAVHSDGTVSLVNGDFLGPSNIGVFCACGGSLLMSPVSPGRAGQLLAHGGGQHFHIRYLERVGQRSEPKCPGVGQRGEGDGDIAGGVRDRDHRTQGHRRR